MHLCGIWPCWPATDWGTRQAAWCTWPLVACLTTAMGIRKLCTPPPTQAAASLAPSFLFTPVTHSHTVRREQQTCWALVASSGGKKKPCAVLTVLHVEAEGEAGSEKPSKPLQKLFFDDTCAHVRHFWQHPAGCSNTLARLPRSLSGGRLGHACARLHMLPARPHAPASSQPHRAQPPHLMGVIWPEDPVRRCCRGGQGSAEGRAPELDWRWQDRSMAESSTARAWAWSSEGRRLYSRLPLASPAGMCPHTVCWIKRARPRCGPSLVAGLSGKAPQA